MGKISAKFKLPKHGERVRLRGKLARGILRTYNALQWARVEWDADHKGPWLCHLRELETVGDD